VTKHTCGFVISRADLNDMTLKVKLELSVKADDTVEVKNLELDVTLGSAKVSISFVNIQRQVHCKIRQC
jgi:hypothetical protein